MAFTFAAGAGERLLGDWNVTSRGVAVGERRAPICDVAADLIRNQRGASEFIDAHRSAPVTGSFLEDQDLVLVASRAERSMIAKLNPDLRTRTFTLREAVELGRDPVTGDERAEVEHFDESATIHLGGYPAVLHRRRSIVALPEPAPRLPWRRTPHPLDIPDAHHSPTREHLSILKSVREDVLHLRAQLTAFLAPGVD